MKQSVLSKLRRLMALSLALLLTVSLIGCSKKDEPETPDSTEGQSQTVPATDAVPTEAPTDAPTEAPTEPPVQTVMGTVSANNLNVRSNPSTDSTVLSQLPVNLRVEILEQKTVGETNWGRIGEMQLPNGTKITGGWINLQYVKLDGQSAETPSDPSDGTGASKMGTVNASELNIRKSPSSDSERVGTYIKGDRVEILEQKTVDGTVWGRTNKGWISMKYVNLDGATNSDNTVPNNPNPNKGDGNNGTSSEVVSNGKTKVLGYAVVDLDSLNVRTGPGTNYDKVGTVTNGSRYAYYQTSGNWIRTKNGWISKSYVYIEGTNGNDGGVGTVTADELNLRAGPGSDYKSNGAVKKGDTVTILAQVNGWGYTSKGWVSMKYITLAAPTYPTGKGTVTADELNIRKEPKADAEKVGEYKEGDSITITQVKDGWGKTDKGWVSMKYVSIPTGSNTIYMVGKATVYVNTTLNVRKEPKADSEVVGYFKNGDTVDVMHVIDKWGKVQYESGKYGWINLKYVKY